MTIPVKGCKFNSTHSITEALSRLAEWRSAETWKCERKSKMSGENDTHQAKGQTIGFWNRMGSNGHRILDACQWSHHLTSAYLAASTDISERTSSIRQMNLSERLTIFGGYQKTDIGGGFSRLDRETREIYRDHCRAC
jgi:hypothetical protein